jgi:hypothetical protein
MSAERHGRQEYHADERKDSAENADEQPVLAPAEAKPIVRATGRPFFRMDENVCSHMSPPPQVHQIRHRIGNQERAPSVLRTQPDDPVIVGGRWAAPHVAIACRDIQESV